jgi:hypothetical protein
MSKEKNDINNLDFDSKLSVSNSLLSQKNIDIHLDEKDKLFTSLNEINSDTDELSKAETKDCNIDKLDPDKLLQ